MSIGDKDRTTAIICLTEKGAELALKLSRLMPPAAVFIPERLRGKHKNGDLEAVEFFSHWKDTFSEVFSKYKQIICIMAAGIVVRSLADLISSKFTDPAVVVVDEAGQFAVSLLSGHVGGANRLAQQAAVCLNGQAVITTATDVSNKPAVDMLAVQMGALLEPLTNIKLINRLLAEGKEVNIYSAFPLIKAFQTGFRWQEWPVSDRNGEMAGQVAAMKFMEPAVIIGPHKLGTDSMSEYIQIKPQNLVVGIGCRRGVEYSEVREAFEAVMTRFGLDKACVKYLATIDIKSEEEAIRQLTVEMGIPVLTFSKNEISALDGSYESSEWVREKVGVGGVCEPAARLAAKQGKTIVPKQKIGPVTISVAMEKSWWWDWGLETENF